MTRGTRKPRKIEDKVIERLAKKKEANIGTIHTVTIAVAVYNILQR